jgi:hypothetical protein
MLRGLPGIRLKLEYVRRNSRSTSIFGIVPPNTVFGRGSTSGPSRVSASVPKWGAIMHMHECIVVKSTE